MSRIMRFEIFKIARDQVLKICVLIAVLVTIVMLSGTNLTIEEVAQKSFLVSVIASLYAVFYVCNDFEDKKILYLVLSGNSYVKMVSTKFIATLLGTQTIHMIFPITVIFLYSKWSIYLKIRILLLYMLLGSVLAITGELFAWLLKKQGVAIFAIIISHIGSLLLMNEKKISAIFMHIIPIGIVKLCLEKNSYFMYSTILGGWFIIMFIITLIIARRSEM